MFCVSNSFVQKIPSEIGQLRLYYKRFLAVTQKKEENVSLLLLRALSCFQPWDQNLSINEKMKDSLKIKF